MLASTETGAAKAEAVPAKNVAAQSCIFSEAIDPFSLAFLRPERTAKVIALVALGFVAVDGGIDELGPPGVGLSR